MSETGPGPAERNPRHGQMLLNRVVADLPPSEHCTAILRDGEPGKEILAAAGERKAGLDRPGVRDILIFSSSSWEASPARIMRGVACRCWWSGQKRSMAKQRRSVEYPCNRMLPRHTNR